MPNTYFQFKKFRINQSRCAMKVGTDGVLLGSLCDFDGCRRIADVGTGTGLVALMVKQRYPDVAITAVEIDTDAYTQAQENFKASPWSINGVNAGWQEYAEACKLQNISFDGIVCNPPYFVNSLKNPSASRTLARHTDSLPFSELIDGVCKTLTADGRFYVILPIESKADFVRRAEDRGLYLSYIHYIHPVVDGAVKRVVMCFTWHRGTEKENHLYIEQSRHLYTDDFKCLTKDFYLD
ncbi:MAG: methyltransferase [Paludibacteraceae bacterium]|nr:methyltransferase [Paludibacteraceae bacterium]